MTAQRKATVPATETAAEKFMREHAARDAALWHKINSWRAKCIDGWRDCHHGCCRRARACTHADFACIVKWHKTRRPLTPKQLAYTMADFRRMVHARMAQLREEAQKQAQPDTAAIAVSQPAAAKPPASQPAVAKGRRRDSCRAAR